MKNLFLTVALVVASIFTGTAQNTNNVLVTEVGDYSGYANTTDGFGYIVNSVSINGVTGSPQPYDITIYYNPTKEIGKQIAIYLFYSNNTMPVGIINFDYLYDGDKSTLGAATAYVNGKGNIILPGVLTAKGGIYERETLYVRINGVVTKIGLNGLTEALLEVIRVMDESVANPFGPTSGNDDPFGGDNDDLNDTQSFVELYDPENLNPYDLYSFLRVFTEDAKRFGLNFDYVYDRSVSLEFNSQEQNDAIGDQTIAYTDTLGNDRKVHIVVNVANWVNADPIKRLAIIYHELGHDILNLDHKDEQGPLMSVYARAEYTLQDLLDLRAEMFDDFKAVQ